MFTSNLSALITAVDELYNTLPEEEAAEKSEELQKKFEQDNV